MPMTLSPINSRNVAILVFDDVEVLDFAGPFEVFSVAGSELPRSPYAPFFPYTVGLTQAPVQATGGLLVQPRFCLASAPQADVLVIPGGNGSRRLLKHAPLLDWVKAQAAQAEVVASVCTGALVLAAAGLLAGRRATTHHGAFDRLPELEPGLSLVRDQRWVRDGKVWTSGGISAGIDLSLAIVRELAGSDAAVVEEMEWMWHAASVAPSSAA